VTPPVEPADLELIRKIATTGGTKYTAGNIDRRKYQRLVALGPIDIHCIQIIAAARWMKPVKLSVRLS
jgi:hypothetical protein